MWKRETAKSRAEKAKWNQRREEMPSVIETFRLIREIVASNSSFLGTMVTSLEMVRTDSAVIRQDNLALRSMVVRLTDACQDMSEKNAVLSNAVNRMTDTWDEALKTITTLTGAASDDTTPDRVPRS